MFIAIDRCERSEFRFCSSLPSTRQPAAACSPCGASQCSHRRLFAELPALPYSRRAPHVFLASHCSRSSHCCRVLPSQLPGSSSFSSPGVQVRAIGLGPAACHSTSWFSWEPEFESRQLPKRVLWNQLLSSRPGPQWRVLRGLLVQPQ